jgi:CRP-like cAMP-binding protein
MDIQAASQIFPLFKSANPQNLSWLLSIATTEEHTKDDVILKVDEWGKAVYFIVSGWVKIQYLYSEKPITQAILSKGELFGEMAILDRSPEKLAVVALTSVHLLSISAQRFIQALSKDNKLQQRLLQLTVRKLRKLSSYLQLQHQPPAVRIIKILVSLAENYGQSDDKGTLIYKIPEVDLADLSDLNVDEIKKIIDNLQSNGWLKIDYCGQTIWLSNLQQLTHLAGKF